MAIFEKKHYGKVISNKLAAYIMYNIKDGDIEEVAKNSNFSPNELTDIIRGYKYLTEDSSYTVQQLFKRCLNNYMKSEKRNREVLNELITKCND